MFKFKVHHFDGKFLFIFVAIIKYDEAFSHNG